MLLGQEKAVIDFKNEMLPDLQKQLLEEEQENFIKKTWKFEL